MTKEQKVIKHLIDLTKGLISLSESQASGLIALCLTETPMARAELFRFSLVKDSYELIRTVSIRNYEINRLILKHTQSKPVEFFYRYDVYDNDGQFCTYIYSINSDLLG